MMLAEFNRLDAEAAADLVRPCADVPRWIDAVIAGRPYSNVEECLSVARRAGRDWTDSEIDGALNAHPRIGERAAGGSKEAELSRAEQSGVDAHDEALHEALVRGNRAYEHRFGRIFLIRAAGRSAGEILAELERRLGNSPEDEQIEAAEQLREIALLRLEGALTS